MLRDWERHRSLARRSKAVADDSMLLLVSLSIWRFRKQVLVRQGGALLEAVGAWVVLRIPTRK